MTVYVWKIRDYSVRPITVAPQQQGNADSVDAAIAAIREHWPEVPPFEIDPKGYEGQSTALSAGWPKVNVDKTAWIIERTQPGDQK